MGHQVLVATAAGLFELGGRERVPVHPLAGRDVAALARQGRHVWAVVDGRELWRWRADADWAIAARLDGPAATALLATPDGLLVGTEQAHLLRIEDGRPVRLEAFDAVEGRAAWYTPWGDPADVRSLAADPAGRLYVNVHVGGVVRSADGGATWQPTLDIEADVHQVVTDPARPGLVLVAAAVGLGISRDGGATWRFETEGLHAAYCRAAAVADDTVLVSASSGHSARRGAVYRRRLDGPGSLERCAGGLPRWFGGNVDTAGLAAAGPAVVLASPEGAVFLSEDRGERWSLLADGLPEIRAVLLD